ncbi:MAG: leucine-rich repeat protein [Muribaculaceae bacterium]|nr:leucine-rich repeat protein [Muribaculaceae bacterium]
MKRSFFIKFFLLTISVFVWSQEVFPQEEFRVNDELWYVLFYDYTANDIKIDSAILTYPHVYLGDWSDGYENLTSTDVSVPTSITLRFQDINGNVFYRTGPVVGVDRQSFSYSTCITSVSIPSGMNVYYFALDDNKYKRCNTISFVGCTNLTSVTLPSCVTRIGGDTEPHSYDHSSPGFVGCVSLTRFSIPNTVTTIGYGAFAGCSSLYSVDIPNSVTTIGAEAFVGCSSLYSVDIPSSVTTIGQDAFRWCSNLYSVDIPNSVTYIGDCAFQYCSNLYSVDIPNSVTTIGELAFARTGLHYVSLPNSINYISSTAFLECDSIETVFWNVRNYSARTNNTTHEGYGALLFGKNERLRRVYIGSDVQSITAGRLFYKDTDEDNDLELVISYAVIPPVLSCPYADIFSPETYSNTVLYVPKESLQAYRLAPVWKKFFHIVAIGEDVVAGDVNGDGQVTIDDVVALIDYLLSGNASLEDVANADCNGDGQVTIDDVVALIDYLLSGTW